MSLEKVKGSHPVFYYYGMEHLLVALAFYISSAIKNNEFVYVSTEEYIYEKLIRCLKKSNIDTQYVQFKPVKELIVLHKKDGLPALRYMAENIAKKAMEKGYSGIRWIGQPTYAIQTTSKKDFLNWEKDLSQAFKGIDASLLCVYDYFDYLHDKVFIDDEVINESEKTHTHLLYQDQLLKNEK